MQKIKRFVLCFSILFIYLKNSVELFEENLFPLAENLLARSYFDRSKSCPRGQRPGSYWLANYQIWRFDSYHATCTNEPLGVLQGELFNRVKKNI